MERRNEIDGLRAVAVLAVVFNHAGLGLLPGGFTGVDIFFVISGFLISRIITDGVADGSFTLSHFWERRARRILPALIPVVALSLATGYVLLLPDDYENLAQSAVATVLFANNVLLTLTSGYWDLAASFKPLLHSWSLGVEEQFYIVYPLAALLVLRRPPDWFGPVLMGGVMASFALSVWLSPRHPDASFYLIHTRAWELLLGALAAHYQPRLRVAAATAKLLALAGLALIGAGLVLIAEGSSYPGWRALLPCIGTALILLYGDARGAAYRALSWPPLLLIGLASYSIYLWHQPLFAFARAASLGPPGPGTMAGLTVATLAIGCASWWWIEQPLRDARRWPLPRFAAVTGTGAALIVAAGLAIHATSGLPHRAPGMGLEQGDYAAYNNAVFRFQKDRFDDPARPNLLVVGNSTARDVVNILVESGRFTGFEIVYRTDISLCSPGRTRGKASTLLADADAALFVASASPPGRCKASPDARDAVLADKPWLLIGPKHFGYNLNAWMRLAREQRLTARAVLLPETVAANAAYRRIAPAGRYLDLLGLMDRRHGGLPVFDAQGRILSADRLHLTQAGAAFFGATIFDDPAWRPIFALTDR